MFEKIEEGENFGLVEMDIYMPGMSGISIAQELRQRHINAPIIFLTTSKEHALEAFGVGAMQYLLKPFEIETFFSTLDYAMEKATTERRRKLIMKTVDGLRAVNIRDILYAESYDKVQHVILMDKTTLTLRLTLSELSGLLSPYPDFVRCGASYILNLAHLHALDKKWATMKNGVTIKIPRGAYAELKVRFMEFFYERQES